MALITAGQVAAAYEALATGERARIAEHWAEDMRWLVPGHNRLSGWKNNLDEFVGFMAEVGRLSGNSFRMDRIGVMFAENFSADVTRNLGTRAGDPDRVLDIDVIHFLTWRDGKVIEGRGAIFGDGTAQYDSFWSDTAGVPRGDNDAHHQHGEMRPMAIRSVIEKYYDCVNRGAWQEWLTLFSDDVVGDEQLAGHFAGIDVLRGAVSGLSSGYSQFRMYPQRIVLDGDAACVVWRCVAANAAGTPIAYPDDPQRLVIGANYFQVQNGKIVYMRTIHDSLPFLPFTSQSS